MMGERNICFVATHAYALFNPLEKSAHGGSEVQLYTIAKELAKNVNYDINFVVGDFNQEKEEYYGRVKVIKSFNPQSRGASVLKKGLQAFRYFLILVKQRPDVCITSSANSTVGVVGLYGTLFRKKHIHRIAHINDVNGKWVSQNGFLGKVYKYGLEHANEVVCQTHEQKRALQENHDVSATLFRNVFDFDDIKTHKKKDYVLWVGRANRIKRAEKFLELARRNPKKKFVMIFNRQNEEYYDEIYSDAEKIKNLRFIEKVPFEKIQKYFDEARVFVSTSEAEGFANTFIQSGIGRTPILSLGSNPDDFLGKYGCGFFAGNDMDKLNSDLDKLFSDKRLYSKFSNNVFEYVKDKYDIKKNIEVIKRLL